MNITFIASSVSITVLSIREYSPTLKTSRMRRVKYETARILDYYDKGVGDLKISIPNIPCSIFADTKH